MFHPTVARLTFRGLLGRRRALLLCALPALLILMSAAVRAMVGADDEVAGNVLGGFAFATMVPLIGVIAGTGATGPETDDGSIVYLLAKPVKRPVIVLTKLAVAMGVAVCFSAVPTVLAGFLLNGNGQNIALAYGAAAAVASVAYSAIFVLLGIVTRHAVVIGLVYALVWESLIGHLVPGARALSVQQWALAPARTVAAEGWITSDVTLPAALVMLIGVTAAATWYAGHRLRSLTLVGGD